jgi:hypothetical protein
LPQWTSTAPGRIKLASNILSTIPSPI